MNSLNLSNFNQTPLNISQIKDSYKIVLNGLNKACTNGSFTFDEAYVVKVSIDTINKSINKLGSELSHSSTSYNDIDIQKLREAQRVVINALNKSCTNGSFNLDEIYIIKIAFDNLTKVIRKVEDDAKPNTSN